MPAYYNEVEPYAAQWLRNLIAAGHIAPGDVDERSIVDVRADDLRGYRQCHFFAGIGVWSYALRRAGWSDDREVWTGSCPCQPFSSSGYAAGFNDSRHLWPNWKGLIVEQRPNTIFGEQVSSADGLAWLDFVCADMEAAGYVIGAIDTCAAGVGAPHIRQRTFWVANAESATLEMPSQSGDGLSGNQEEWTRHGASPGRRCDLVGMAAHADIAIENERPSGREQSVRDKRGKTFWDESDWLPCQDGCHRPVEPGTFPLAHGIASRMDKVRAYGNAIVPQVAAAFIQAAMESIGQPSPAVSEAR